MTYVFQAIHSESLSQFEGMRKGESFQDFSKRLAQETKVEIIKAVKESKEPTQKHKRYVS